MKQTVKIAPSLLACDFTRIKNEIEKMEICGSDMLHLDVMDGIFVPNISFGMPVIEAIRKNTDMFLDAHLMITEPERYIDEFVRIGCDNITFHVEATKDPHRTLKLIKDKGILASVSVKPNTPIRSVLPLLEEVDMVLVMTVEPGFGGQSFMPDMMDKVRFLKDYRSENSLSYDIQVDGGIGASTVEIAAEAGANVFVAGSAVFKAPDAKTIIDELKNRANKYFI